MYAKILISQCFFYLLDLTGMRFVLLFVVHADKNNLSAVVFKDLWVVPVFDLSYSSVGVFVPLKAAWTSAILFATASLLPSSVSFNS